MDVRECVIRRKQRAKVEKSPGSRQQTGFDQAVYRA